MITILQKKFKKKKKTKKRNNSTINKEKNLLYEFTRS